MSGVVVVDASLAVKWLVSEVHSGKAYGLALRHSTSKPSHQYT
jgi:predicted nucleic acid-binding protein